MLMDYYAQMRLYGFKFDNTIFINLDSCSIHMHESSGK